MDNNFSFLHDGQAQALFEILARRNAGLLDRITKSRPMSREDADQVVITLSDEFTDHLDEDWEPTDYGHFVGQLLALVNAARIAEWPDK